MMDRIFLDSDVILDLLMERELFYIESQMVFASAEKCQVKLFTSTLVISNIYYVLCRYQKREKAINGIIKLRAILNFLSVTERIIDKAIALNLKDFEDAIQYCVAYENGMDFILTRNEKDYPKGNINIKSPTEFLILKKILQERR